MNHAHIYIHLEEEIANIMIDPFGVVATPSYKIACFTEEAQVPASKHAQAVSIFRWHDGERRGKMVTKHTRK